MPSSARRRWQAAGSRRERVRRGGGMRQVGTRSSWQRRGSARLLGLPRLIQPELLAHHRQLVLGLQLEDAALAQHLVLHQLLDLRVLRLQLARLLLHALRQLGAVLPLLRELDLEPHVGARGCDGRAGPAAMTLPVVIGSVSAPL